MLPIAFVRVHRVVEGIEEPELEHETISGATASIYCSGHFMHERMHEDVRTLRASGTVVMATPATRIPPRHVEEEHLLDLAFRAAESWPWRARVEFTKECLQDGVMALTVAIRFRTKDDGIRRDAPISNPAIDMQGMILP